MSVSDAAAFTTRSSRSRGSKLLNNIHPEEELAKHDSRSTAKAIRVPSSSRMHVMSSTPAEEDEYREPIRVPSSSRMLQANIIENHTRDDEYRDMRTPANSPFAQPRSKSKTKSVREPTYNSLSATPRIISYGPSTEERMTHSLDSIHSLDPYSTETQSSSKTIPLDEAHDAKLSPLSTLAAPLPQPATPLFFTKDVVIHIACSLLILGLLMLAISGGLAPHGLIRSFKGRAAIWTQVATSNQVQEWREHLKLTLKVTTERLEERVEGLKEEMREEMKRRKEEAEEMREEMLKLKLAREKETTFGNNKDKRTNSHLPLATPSQWASGVDEVATLASAVQAVPWTVAVGRPDYALASGGGRVVGHSLAYKPAGSASWIDSLSSLFIPLRLHPLSLVILQPSFNQPGQCLPLASSNVHVEVALRTPIFPDQVTLSHVSKSIAYDISSAPKDFHVYGLPPPLSSAKPASWILLGEFTYDIDKPLAAQTFNLSETAKKTLLSTIKLHVLSNYGSASHTCIYRLQVHGKNPQ